MEKQNNYSQRIFLIIIIGGIALICFIMVLFAVKLISSDGLGFQAIAIEIVTPTLPTAQINVIEPEEKPTTAPEKHPFSAQTPSVLDILEAEEVSQNDPLDLAMRFLGVSNPQKQLEAQSDPKKNGVKEYFWVLDVDENDYQQVTAELIFQTDHLYFWVEEGVDYDYQELVQLATIFEEQIYPLNREMFGSEWTPGVDNDDHLVILYAKKLGGASGYFSGTDSLMPDVKRYTNIAEMFYLSAQYNDLDNSFTYGVLAHEFQHMIHWNQDRNESSWLNEGLSELAVDINGFDIGGFDYLFAFNPDIPLTYWPGEEQGDSTPHYGASFLFIKYIYAQYGSQAILDIVQNQENGMISIDAVLEDYLDAADGIETVRPGDQVFQNWTIANILQDAGFQNGLYGYEENAKIPPFYTIEELGCDTDWIEGTVNQYGTDYIEINCEDDFVIEVAGNDSVKLLPADPYSGSQYFWSNSGDESHMSLSQEFDFVDIDESISLNYWTWYDLESDYDYVYLSASSDGEHWEILHPTNCTTENPTGGNYGCGYNGQSAGWQYESVDLSHYAGEKVTIQFEYLTDAAVNGEGFILDDVSIPAIGYFSDFESSSGGWVADGFVKVSNTMPQSYSLALIKKSGESQVEKWISSSGLEQTIEVINNERRITTLAISGLTRYTHLPATYKLKVTRLD